MCDEMYIVRMWTKVIPFSKYPYLHAFHMKPHLLSKKNYAKIILPAI